VTTLLRSRTEELQQQSTAAGAAESGKSTVMEKPSRPCAACLSENEPLRMAPCTARGHPTVLAAPSPLYYCQCAPLCEGEVAEKSQRVQEEAEGGRKCRHRKKATQPKGGARVGGVLRSSTALKRTTRSPILARSGSEFVSVTSFTVTRFTVTRFTVTSFRVTRFTFTGDSQGNPIHSMRLRRKINRRRRGVGRRKRVGRDMGGDCVMKV
jgi:hypothetical protein